MFACSLFNDAFSVTTLYSVRWKGDTWLTSWKRCGRKQLWSNFEVLSQHLHKRIENNHRKPVRIAGLWPRFESGISQIWSSSVNHSMTGQHPVICMPSTPMELCWCLISRSLRTNMDSKKYTGKTSSISRIELKSLLSLAHVINFKQINLWTYITSNIFWPLCCYV
jgi:hypothetical protein